MPEVVQSKEDTPPIIVSLPGDRTIRTSAFQKCAAVTLTGQQDSILESIHEIASVAAKSETQLQCKVYSLGIITLDILRPLLRRAHVAELLLSVT